MWGKRCAGLKLLLLPVALLGAVTAAAQDKAVPAAAPTPSSTIIVLDASRSMWVKIRGTSKIAIARSELGQAVTTYDDRLSFGLVAFGHRQASNCADTQVLAKVGKLTSKTQRTLLGGVKPKGQTPIGAAITEAARAGQFQSEKLDIVLLADGVESCKADLCTTADVLKQKSKNLRIHVIGFDSHAKKNLRPLSCIAEATGGQFITATNASELKEGLTTVLDAIAIPGTPANAAVAEGGGDSFMPAPAASSPVPRNDATGALPGPPGPAGTDAAATGEGGQPPGSPPAEIQPSGAPGQTEMQKSAAPAPGQSAPPAEAPPLAPAQPSLPVPVTFKALLTDAGPKLQSGLIWRVFSPVAAPDGSRKLVSTHREAAPTAALLPGDYLVNAAYGLSNLTKKIKVESGRSLEETFVLNAGGLKLAAMLADGEPLPQGSVHFDILSDEEDQFGNRHTILSDAKPGLIIRLNAGAYHIISLYGDANATVRTDVTVEPGKITEATVKHAAAKVTFKLVQDPGGEALADTQWSILTPAGDVVKENAGALPTHILAAGNYAVVASHNGSSYTTKFDVGTGEAKQIEVVVEDGPATPEALKAITDPPPPPEPAATNAGPDAPDSGMAFGGSATSPEHGTRGLFSNPGALLRPAAR
jgi:hypothetical protein